MNKTARNERTKITATAINNLAVALTVTGVIVPSVGLASQLAVPRSGYWYAFALLWAAAGISLDLIARIILGRIEE
jgi:hypothetical protein